MSKRKTGAAEAAIHTNNEHWNGYALAFLCKVKEGGKFPDVDKAMDLYCEVLDILQGSHDEPLKGDRAAEALLTKAGMNEEQCAEINLAAYTYLKGSEFDVDLSVSIALLKGRTKPKAGAPWTAGAREGLQELVRRELAALPTTLEGLEPKERIAALCKLLPFALPRLANVELNDAGKSTW
jgi:hypothetical protein